MKVLHITTWFPNQLDSKEGVFIQRHVEAVGKFVDYEILHLQVKPNNKFSYINKPIKRGRSFILTLPFESWFFIEIVSSVVLLFYLLRADVNRKFDIINFHIAYPNLTYWHLIKKYIRIPVIITEHWSAYHLNFGVGINKSLPRIERIFKQKIPVIAVSNALLEDIRLFSQGMVLGQIIPNIVEEEYFNFDARVEREKFFFMVSKWKEPKNPFLVLEAFKKFCKASDFRLVIGGYGEQWPDIISWVESQKMNGKIELVGELKKEEIADYLKRCWAFLHPSHYETFSVVCAEAISCGTPVIASNVGGIPEVINNNGILLEGYKVDEWVEAIKEAIEKPITVSTKSERFSPEVVGKQYYNFLEQILSGDN